MFFSGKSITIQHMHMQHQAGGSDCVLFALATATAICNGMDPGALDYQQRQMRDHFKKRLELKVLLPFPAKGIAKRSPSIICVDRLRIHCECRQPYDGRQMVKCTTCKKWFHNICVAIPDAAVKNEDIPWYCASCAKL